MKTTRCLGSIVVVFLIACAHSQEEHEGHGTPAPPSAMATDHSAMDHGAAASAAVPSGYAAVTIDPATAAAHGLTTARVEHRMFTKDLRTVGIVTLDESKTAHVHAKVRGFIEAIQADFVGKSVSTGAPLCAIYSQSVYAAELELVALLDQKTPPSDNALVADAEQKSWTVITGAAKRRLMLWDVPKGEIARLEATRLPSRTFTLFAPRGGVIISKQAFVGNYVDQNTELYVISDLKTLWVQLDVYEAELAYVHAGDAVQIAIEGIEKPIDAKVSFIAPTIDEASRTLKVRVDVPNPDGLIRPGAFASATMHLAMGHGLGLAEDAVIHTGPREIVFVVHGGAHIMPREVKLGPLVNGYYRVISGLEENDQVATGAQFLLDSESRLRATSEGGGAHDGHAGH